MKKNNTIALLMGLGVAAALAFKFFKKGSSGTTTSAKGEGYDITDLSISLADFGNMQILDSSLPPLVSFDLLINLSNKGAKGVGCKRFVIEISDATKQITSLDLSDKDGKDIAYFSQKTTSQSTINVKSNLPRSLELLDMTYAKISSLIDKGILSRPTIPFYLKNAFQYPDSYFSNTSFWEYFKQPFTKALKFSKTVTVKATAYLADENGNTFTTTTKNTFEI